MTTELYALPLNGPLADTLQFVAFCYQGQTEAFIRGEIEGDTLVIDPNGEDHFCDICGQLFAEPIFTLEIPFRVSVDDPRTIRVVLGVCDKCKADLASRSEEVASDGLEN